MIIGIAALRYGADDVVSSTEFFRDFGLPLLEASPTHGLFVLEEGSRVEITDRHASGLDAGSIKGPGVHEVIWGVDDSDGLARLANDLAGDHTLIEGEDGTLRFTPFFGIPMGLRLWQRRPVLTAPDPINAPGCTRRLNSPRKWKKRALPKIIQHVVYESAEYAAASEFMRRRLGFRITDIQKGSGHYLRAPGNNAHHNLLLLNANSSFAHGRGATCFHHANFAVEDIDEVMLGANYMVRKGWEASEVGLGRHRIDSGLFYYLPCPAGGEAEYAADGDCVDDNWVPRNWINPLFGYAHYTHNLPSFFQQAPEWRFEYLEDGWAENDLESGIS